jgi:salicylate hydroxylase
VRSSTTDHGSMTDHGGIAVIGAGIAGLTFAAALRRAGLSCTVYEQAAELGEVGAGIQLAPNAVRLLERLGLAGTLAAVAVSPDALEVRQWRDGRLVGRTQLGPSCVDRFGAGYYTLHRAELHRCLVDAVVTTRPGGPGGTAGGGSGTARIELGRRCVGLVETPDAVELRFADGTTARAGLVVGADGIRSVVRRALADDEPRYSGTTVYRGLVPAGSQVRQRVAIWLGPGQHCVWYPVSGGRTLSFAAVVRDPGDESTDDESTGDQSTGDQRTDWRAESSRPATSRDSESWRTPGEVADLGRAFAGWHPEVVDTLAAAESVTRWALHDRAPLASWHSARLVVIGDAAHPLLPFGAHGANQAVESAVTLATCLGRVATDCALAAYERVRMDRLARVSATVVCNHHDHHLTDGRHQRLRDRRMASGLRLSEQDWLYGYDAEAAAGVEAVNDGGRHGFVPAAAPGA